MVRIVSSCMVFPLEPTPRKLMPLSLSDQVQPWTLAPLIFVYNQSWNTISGIESLKQSLSSVLVPFYPFAGRLMITENGMYHLDCNAKGAQFFEAEIDETLEDFGDFGPTSEKVQNLVSVPDYTRPIQERPVLVVQFTRFKCGGCTLGFATSHAVADGFANLHFQRSWGKIARGEKIDVLPFHDRTQLSSENFTSFTGPIFNHEELQSLPLLVGSSDTMAERMKQTSPATLILTKYQIEKLKNQANEDDACKEPNQRPYSRFEVVTAHIWKCLCKARGGSKDQLTKLRFPLNIRQRIKPPLPDGYFGNATFPTITSKCFLNDIASKPLSYAAKRLREANDRLTDDYIKSYLYSLASHTEEQNKLRGNFHIQGTTQGVFVGNPNMTVTSWINLPFYEADYGWGKPIFMGPTVLNSDGKCIILPRAEGDGSLLVLIRVQTIHMDAFKTYFYEDLIDDKQDTKILNRSKI